MEQKEFAFHQLWTNADSEVTIIDFPQVAINKLLTYKRDVIDKTVDYEELINKPQKSINTMPKNVFRIPESVSFNDHPYQLEAINKWINSDSIGIFDMATGTGKTYTALGALSKLSEKLMII